MYLNTNRKMFEMPKGTDDFYLKNNREEIESTTTSN